MESRAMSDRKEAGGLTRETPQLGRYKEMANGGIRIKLVWVVLAAALCSSSFGAEVSWIASGSEPQPSAWSIEPQRPTQHEVIRFSGPTSRYLNHCLAENALAHVRQHHSPAGMARQLVEIYRSVLTRARVEV